MKVASGILCILLLALAAAAFYYASGLTPGIALAAAAAVFGVAYIILEQLELRAVRKKTETVREEFRVECIALHKLSFKHMPGASEAEVEEMASILTYGSALLMGAPYSRISYPSGYLLKQYQDGLCVLTIGRQKLEARAAAAAGTPSSG